MRAHCAGWRGAAVLLSTALVTGALLGCTPEGGATGGSPGSASAPVKAGRGQFDFTAPRGNKGTVTVYYDAPENGLSDATILIVMPGQHRNAVDYRADWEPLVRGRHVLLLVPEFSEEEFPGPEQYNLGNVVDDAGDPNPPSDWSYALVEQLFDRVVADIHGQQQSYRLFGHSAGAQFAHRLVELMPDNHASIAVAANAGWYTMPSDALRFPYGLKGIPLDERDLRRTFARELVVLLGGDDIDAESSSVRQDPGARDQGSHRLARGLAFYLAARQTAADHGMPFAWRLQVVPGVAHDHTAMARAAAPLLLP